MEFSIYNVKFKDLLYYGKLTHIPERIIYSHKFQYLMSAEISYRKQGMMIIFGLLIVFVVVELAAQFWWYNIETCAFEQSDVYADLPPETKRQMCIQTYEVQYSVTKIDPNQHYDTINIKR